MEIRRAILLFAVVLGLAALVTSFTRPADEEGDRGAPDAETEDRRESSGDGPRTQPRPLPAPDRPAARARVVPHPGQARTATARREGVLTLRPGAELPMRPLWTCGADWNDSAAKSAASR